MTQEHFDIQSIFRVLINTKYQFACLFHLSLSKLNRVRIRNSRIEISWGAVEDERLLEASEDYKWKENSIFLIVHFYQNFKFHTFSSNLLIDQSIRKKAGFLALRLIMYLLIPSMIRIKFSSLFCRFFDSLWSRFNFFRPWWKIIFFQLFLSAEPSL